MPHSILIVGGGFAGVEAAKTLATFNLPDTTVRLLDPKSHFEYHAALYRFITGRSPMETCIAYRDIFDGFNVDVVRDRATAVDLKAKTVIGESGSRYCYDTLMLAVGSETSFFGIPGAQACAHGMKTMDEAVRLKRRLDEIFSTCPLGAAEERSSLLHLVIVGGGPSGVELAGELGWYARKLARHCGVDPSIVIIDLIEAEDRILPMLPERASEIVMRRLRSLGVSVLVKHSIVREDVDEVCFPGKRMNAKIVVWTAGMRGSPLLEKIQGLSLDTKGRVEVDEHLRAKGHMNVFALGDSAATTHSGMAQTALYDGQFAAKVFAADFNRQGTSPTYQPPIPVVAVPVGPQWAMVLSSSRIFTGYIGWMLRRWADLKVFLRLLPFGKAIRAFRSMSMVERFR